MIVMTVEDVKQNLIIKYDKSKSLMTNIDIIVKDYLKLTDKDNRINTRIYQHTLRVMRYADMLLKKEKGVDREVVMVSLLLHDIGKTITDHKHDVVSYCIASHIFNNIEIDSNKRKKILDTIVMHSAKSIHCLNLSLEQKIVMDADLLDEIGTLTIIKHCLKDRNKNKNTTDVCREIETLYNKIETETAFIRTKQGKELYNRKKKHLKQLIEDFKYEIMEFKIDA